MHPPKEDSSMRKYIKLFSILAAPLAVAALATNVHAAGSVDFFAGQKELDTDFGGDQDIEEQDAVALFTDWGPKDSSWRFAVDLLAGRADRDDDELDIHLDGSTGEIGAGARWYPVKESRWMPHLGAGLALVSGEVETNGSGANDLAFDDSKVGYWADGGVAYRFGEHFKVGGRIRYSDAKLDQRGDVVREVNAGGLTYGINAGVIW
jgi:opacity protein-like surface antigen